MAGNDLIYADGLASITTFEIQISTRGDLGPEYEAVERRLDRFRDVPREAAQRAWDMLLM